MLYIPTCNLHIYIYHLCVVYTLFILSFGGIRRVPVGLYIQLTKLITDLQTFFQGTQSICTPFPWLGNDWETAWMWLWNSQKHSPSRGLSWGTNYSCPFLSLGCGGKSYSPVIFYMINWCHWNKGYLSWGGFQGDYTWVSFRSFTIEAKRKFNGGEMVGRQVLTANIDIAQNVHTIIAFCQTTHFRFVELRKGWLKTWKIENIFPFLRWWSDIAFILMFGCKPVFQNLLAWFPSQSQCQSTLLNIYFLPRKNNLKVRYTNIQEHEWISEEAIFKCLVSGTLLFILPRNGISRLFSTVSLLIDTASIRKLWVRFYLSELGIKALAYLWVTERFKCQI